MVVHSIATDGQECVQMPGEMVESALRPPFRRADALVGRPHLAAVLLESRK